MIRLVTFERNVIFALQFFSRRAKNIATLVWRATARRRATARETARRQRDGDDSMGEEGEQEYEGSDTPADLAEAISKEYRHVLVAPAGPHPRRKGPGVETTGNDRGGEIGISLDGAKTRGGQRYVRGARMCLATGGTCTLVVGITPRPFV